MPPFIVPRIRIKKQISFPKCLHISQKKYTFAAHFPYRNEKHNRVTHLDPDLEIEFEDAEKSIEIDRGLAAHYQASADRKQRLLDIARAQQAEAERYKQLYAQEQVKNIRLKEENMRLEARVAELEARPQYQVGQYVEKMTIKKQVLSAPRAPQHKKSSIDLTNQYSLWDQNALSL